MVLLSCSLFAQDSTKAATRQDTARIPALFILSDHNRLYMNHSQPDTITRKRFLWLPVKSLEDVFGFLPGYYMNYMDVGQLNPIDYNQLGADNTVVLRHGRAINDPMDGSIDLNLLSRNEIDEIEISGGFGNSIYDNLNTVNILQRQVIQNRTYTEISFYQDRYENIYFDGNFHKNFLRNLNFNFGITKHSYDGHYRNSDFDKWLGRFNLKFAPSNKLNFFAYVNYAKIQKGLNEGINSDTVNIGNKTEMFNGTTAIVNNPDAYERKERFDVDIGGVLLAGKISYTKLQFYASNSFKEYRDEENRTDPNGIFLKTNYHWINYGADLKEQLRFGVFKDAVLLSNTELSLESLIKQTSGITANTYSANTTQTIRFLQELDLDYKNINLAGYIKGYSNSNSNTAYYFSGIRTNVLLNLTKDIKLDVRGAFNSKYNYVTAGFLLTVGENRVSSDLYFYDNWEANSVAPKGVNSALNFRLFKFDLKANYSYNVVPEFNVLAPIDGRKYFPAHYGSAMISWHDMAFKNKLEYNIGVSSRLWSEHNSLYYNNINNALQIPYSPSENNYDVKVPANATLDFFIMGKIGRATFGITLENILDRLIYNTGVYPYMDRGGLFNTISRFNITWNFFD
jgi:hypothetical protein